MWTLKMYGNTSNGIKRIRTRSAFHLILFEMKCQPLTWAIVFQICSVECLCPALASTGTWIRSFSAFYPIVFIFFTKCSLRIENFLLQLNKFTAKRNWMANKTFLYILMDLCRSLRLSVDSESAAITRLISTWQLFNRKNKNHKHKTS